MYLKVDHENRHISTNFADHDEVMTVNDSVASLLANGAAAVMDAAASGLRDCSLNALLNLLSAFAEVNGLAQYNVLGDIGPYGRPAIMSLTFVSDVDPDDLDEMCETCQVEYLEDCLNL